MRPVRSGILLLPCLLAILAGLANVATAAGPATAAPLSADAPDTGRPTSDAANGKHRGTASYYSKHLSGQKTASGASYDPQALTAAHRTLPLGTKLKVVNPKNDRSVVVTVNDRGPVPKNRMLDVSSAAADRLGMKKSGVTKVEAQVVGKTDPSKEAEPVAAAH